MFYKSSEKLIPSLQLPDTAGLVKGISTIIDRIAQKHVLTRCDRCCIVRTKPRRRLRWNRNQIGQARPLQEHRAAITPMGSYQFHYYMVSRCHWLLRMLLRLFSPHICSPKKNNASKKNFDPKKKLVTPPKFFFWWLEHIARLMLTMYSTAKCHDIDQLCTEGETRDLAATLKQAGQIQPVSYRNQRWYRHFGGKHLRQSRALVVRKRSTVKQGTLQGN